jgi:hypothetical protein
MILSSIAWSPRKTLFGALLFLSCAVITSGCAASLDETEWVDTTPVNVQVYPHESYGGRDVYYIGGRWQYQSGGRWAAYRHEPTELRIRRARRPAEAREEHGERR